MKKGLHLVLPVLIFLPTLLYLHQKVQIYVQAYQLSNNYRYHNELVDKRDYLMYNFAKEVSLAKVNQWAVGQNFTPVDRNKMYTLNTKGQEKISDNKIVSLINRFLRVSTATSTALAKD